MKIVVRSGKFRLRLYVPNIVLKSRLFYKYAIGKAVANGTPNAATDRTETANASDDALVVVSCDCDVDGSDESTFDADNTAAECAAEVEVALSSASNNAHARQQAANVITRSTMVAVYRTLKRIIKTYGHFNLVEVRSDDGDQVIVRL